MSNTFEKLCEDTLYVYDDVNDLWIDKESLIKPLQINNKQYNKWIDSFPINERDNAIELFASMNYIPWKIFKQSLYDSFNKFIENIGNDIYYQYITERKNSTTYMTCLCYKNINKFNINNYGSDIESYYNDNIISHITYIDDCVYSGDQLKQLLTHINSWVDNYKISNIRKLDNDIPYTIINVSIFDLELFIINANIESDKYIMGDKVAYFTDKNHSKYFMISSNGIKLYNTIDELLVNDNVILFNDIISNGYLFKILKRYKKTISYLNNNQIKKSLTLHIIIPYIYKEGYDKIMKFKMDNQKYDIILYNEKIIEIPIFETLSMKILYNLYCIIPLTSYEFSEYPESLESIKYLTRNKFLNKKLTSCIVFDHKIASPVSTIFASILGCGLVLSPALLINNRKFLNIGSLINNINITQEKLDLYSKDIEKYITLNTDEDEEEADIEICNKNFIPVYKLTDNDIINNTLNIF
jgi:hypothetical protein